MNKKANLHWIKTQIKSLKTAKIEILSSYDIVIREEEETTYKILITELNRLINHYINELEYIEARNNYQYSFKYTENGRDNIVTTRFVKSPTRTKEWRELKKNFDCGFIHSFEYQLIK